MYHLERLILLPLAAVLLAVPGPCQDDLPASPADIELPALRAFDPPAPERRSLEGQAEGTSAPMLLIEDDSLPLVDGLLVFGAGSLRDPASMVGLAEFAADGLREGGCAAFTGAELNAWLDLHAAELSFTATGDHLRISFSCLSEDLDELLARLGALLSEPSFEERAVETTRMQMLTAIARASDDAAALADQTMDGLLYGTASPHGRVATAETVGAISREDLAAWASANLGLNRLRVGLSGDLDVEATVEVASATLGVLPQVGEAAEIPEPTFFIPEHTRIFVVDRPGVPQTELRFGGPGVRLDDPDHAPLTLWSYAVGMGGMSNRMMSRVRTELGLAYGVGCLYSSALPRRGSFYAYCGTRNDAVAEAVSEMIDVITATGAELIPEDELEAARSRLLASQVFRYDTSAEVLSRAMTLDLYGYPTDFWERNLEQLVEVDNIAVGSAIRRRMPPARFLVVAVGPADEIMAQLESVAEVELLEPEAALASAEEEVAAMLTAMGGAEDWARLNTVHVKLTAELIYPSGSAFVPVEQHRRFEPAGLRMRQTTPTGASYTSIITDGPCYLKSPTGVSEVEAEQATSSKVSAVAQLV
ncbi:MAG: pitrilysin family protein, partial [Planctomycetota bacterium]|nr:pitrilysin family protein [Planctomycetota bacterium]